MDSSISDYDFSSIDGTIINDSSGEGKAGVVRPEGSQVETKKVNILGQEYTAFVLQGGQPDATHTYVEMPSGVLNGLEDVTVSCWVYMNEDNSGYQRIWELGSDTTSYMYMIANGFNEGHQGYTCALTNSGWGTKQSRKWQR